MSTRLFCRHANDDYEALLIGTVMEKCGGQVVSITYDGQHQRQGAMIPCSRFIVFGRIGKDFNLDTVDELIDAALFPKEST